MFPDCQTGLNTRSGGWQPLITAVRCPVPCIKVWWAIKGKAYSDLPAIPYTWPLIPASSVAPEQLFLQLCYSCSKKLLWITNTAFLEGFILFNPLMNSYQLGEQQEAPEPSFPSTLLWHYTSVNDDNQQNSEQVLIRFACSPVLQPGQLPTTALSRRQNPAWLCSLLSPVAFVKAVVAHSLMLRQDQLNA